MLETHGVFTASVKQSFNINKIPLSISSLLAQSNGFRISSDIFILQVNLDLSISNLDTPHTNIKLKQEVYL